VNSGFSEIVLPEADYNAIINQISPDLDEANGLSVVNCEQADFLPDITFRVGGTDVIVSAKQYLLDVSCLNFVQNFLVGKF
jgi:hypothetical protein